MAKYTEFLTEYLEDNDLPSIFSEIEGFEELFIQRYCDHEIGFETEALFKIKLEHYANIYIPFYKERIDAVATAYTNLKQPTKIQYNNVLIGARKSKTTELPVDETSAQPKIITDNEASDDTTTLSNTGYTPDEAIRIYDKLNNDVKIIVNTLLDEFKNLFMGIY